MGIRRACSYNATIQTPEAPSGYSSILVTFQQRKVNLVNKQKTDLQIEGDKIVVKLDQSETAQFTAGIPAYLQVRCYKSQYDAPGSACWPLDVFPALNDVILS